MAEVTLKLSTRENPRRMFNHKEDAMTMKRIMLTVGFLSMMAATAGLNASDSFAAGVQRMDVIDHLPTEGVQRDSAKPAEGGVTRVDVIDRLPSKGPVYPSTSGAMRVDVIDNTRV